MGCQVRGALEAAAQRRQDLQVGIVATSGLDLGSLLGSLGGFLEGWGGHTNSSLNPQVGIQTASPCTGPPRSPHPMPPLQAAVNPCFRRHALEEAGVQLGLTSQNCSGGLDFRAVDATSTQQEGASNKGQPLPTWLPKAKLLNL